MKIGSMDMMDVRSFSLWFIIVLPISIQSSDAGQGTCQETNRCQFVNLDKDEKAENIPKAVSGKLGWWKGNIGSPMKVPEGLFQYYCDKPAPCLSNPCLHGGDCILTANGYRCDCILDRRGDRCQYDPFRDCSEVQAGGFNTSMIYKLRIYVLGIAVHCDMETEGGGWTVIQRRKDESVDFNNTLAKYIDSIFRSPWSEHWIGLYALSRMTRSKKYELRIELEDFEGETRYANYREFRIDAKNSYTLVVGGYSGNAGDSLSYHNGFPFTTKENGRTESAGHEDCGVTSTGGWWYTSCLRSNLNGQYLNGTTSLTAEGVVWADWHGLNYSLKRTEMKIRPLDWKQP